MTGTTAAAGTHVLGIDIGGTKIAAGLVSRTGEVTSEREVPTDQRDAGAVASALTSLVDAVLAEAREAGWTSPTSWASARPARWTPPAAPSTR